MSPLETPETGGPDPIAEQLSSLPQIRPWHLLLRSRAALGLGPLGAPALLFVPIGIALGPRVTGVLNEEVLAYLDAVVSLGLATLGVFVGLGLETRSREDRRVLLAGSIDAAMTLVVVTGATLYLSSRWGVPLDVPVVLLSLTLGGCAAASAAGAAGAAGDEAHHLAGRVADADDVLPILGGGLFVALVPGYPLGQAALLLLYTCVLGALLGVAGLLLVRSATSIAERGTFLFGVLLLLAGCTAHLGLAPLAAGFVAGIVWRVGPAGLRESVSQDLSKIQHPVLVLFLIVAGATVEPSPTLVWLLVPFVLFRVAGKVAGAWAATRVLGRFSTFDLGTYLLAPGVLGIALALNFYQVTGSETGTVVVSTVTLAALVGELLAAYVLASPSHHSAAGH